MNGTNKKHMVSYTVDMSENSPVGSTVQTCAIFDPWDSALLPAWQVQRELERTTRLSVGCALQISPDEPPPTLGAPHKWKRKNVSLLDNDAGGYTT